MRLGDMEGIFSPDTTHLRVVKKDNLYFLFNDMAAILNFLTSLRLFIIYT